MAKIQKKSIRKLVTLAPDLAERVDQFRQSIGATSESEALKTLIEDGLKMRDKPEDLFRRCETATYSNQSIGDIINLVTSDHPLVLSAVLDSDALIINLKSPPDTRTERFYYSRANRVWKWQWERDYDNWQPVEHRGPALNKPSDLDDEIPF